MNWGSRPGPIPGFSRWPGPSPISKMQGTSQPSISPKPSNTVVWIVIAAYNMFLPTTIEEAKKLGYDKLDVILITGDAYIDSSFIGVAVIGKVLVNAGFRVGIIAQPAEPQRSPDYFGDVKSDNDITRLGEPELFWGVTAGSVDSMVANYTASKKHRRQDDFTPGGQNDRRPDRASIVYSNLIRKYYKNSKPIVLGGLEASLRRIAHYDYWDDAIRRSILFDSKADIIAYGMAEKTVLELAEAYKNSAEWQNIKGICFSSDTTGTNLIELPSFEDVRDDKRKFFRMFNTFYQNCDDPEIGFFQKHNNKYLIHNPPQPLPTPAELDEIYELNFERDAHPFYKIGEIRALETVKQSITSHRGCFGQCSFCAIAAHQGRRVVSRSPAS